MRRERVGTVLIVLAISTAALAHQGVKNPAVMTRMETMKSIGSETKLLRQMVRGEALFDEGAARAAALEISEHASRVIAEFKDKEDDPKSEALPLIWDQFGDFSALAEELQSVSLSASTDIVDAATLSAAFDAINMTCKTCHDTYAE